MNIDKKVMQVFERLNKRSLAEQEKLEVLRKQGGTALRDIAVEFMLDVGPECGMLLNMFARFTNAKKIVEVGGSVGYSTLWLAEAARHTGGKVITFEMEAPKREQMLANLKEAGLDSFVDIRGEDIQKYADNISAPIDFIFLDHWKELYSREFKLLWPKLRRNGLLVADNIIRPEKNKDVIAAYLQFVSTIPDARTVTVDIGDGIEVTCKE